MEFPLISVIIATHNSESTIQQCIHSLTSQSYPREKFEIIVVDDGSKDRSVEYSKKAGADLVIISEPCSLGRARNIGAEKTHGKFLAFFDSDCEAKRGWLETIAKELETKEAISGPVLNGNIDSLVAWADYLMEFSIFNEHKNRSLISFMPGCNQICTRRVFQEVGGFPDSRLSDDVFFGNMLKQSGITIEFVPDLKISHLCRTKINKFLSNQELLGKYSVRTSRKISSSYTKFTRTKLTIPLIFILRIGAKARNAKRAKKLRLFFITFPLIILGSYAWCKGVWNEI